MIRILLVVEGEKTEVDVFKELFTILGFSVVQEPKRGNFSRYTISTADKLVYLIPGPKQQVLEIMKEFDSASMDLSLFFNIPEPIALNYIVYDADDTIFADFSSLIENFKSSQDGLILLSNPCFEVLADNVYDTHHKAPKYYKKKVRQQLISTGSINPGTTLLQYMVNNIIGLLIEQVRRNEVFFNSSDIYNHAIDSYNLISSNVIDRTLNIYTYSNLFSVIFVILGDIFEVSKYENNTQKLITKLTGFL